MNLIGKLRSDDLLRHSAVLFSGMMAVHLCNMLFQMLVGRMLPRAEYTLLAAFLGGLAILQRPLVTLTTGLSYYSSLLRQDNRLGDIKRLLKKWLLLTSVPSLVLGCAVILLNTQLARFLHLDRLAPVTVTGAVLPALFVLPVLGGTALGLQMFGWSACANIFGAAARLVLGAGFVWLLYPACGWAMLGHGLGMYISVSILIVVLMLLLRQHTKSTEALPSMRFYLLQSFFIQAAYAVLMVADVVLVKHYLPADTEFAYAATLGRMVVFLPGAIVAAMFPKVTARGAGSREQHRIFLKSLGLTALFVGVTVAGCFLLPSILTRILFGISDASHHLKQMVGLMALVMGISALLNVVVQFLLAQRRFRSGLVVVGSAVLYLLLTAFFHESTLQIVAIAGGANLISFLFMLWFALRPSV